MRTVSALSLALAAVLGLASAAQAAPASAAAARVPVLADVGVGVGIGVGPARPFGYRWAGGYYRTEYRWVWIEGALSHVDAFGRAVYRPGHWELLPFRVWVPYSVRYARPYTRSVTGGIHVGTGYRW